MPGPNVLAYYFAFRIVGHYLSWRGRAPGLDDGVDAHTPMPALAELGQLVADRARRAKARVDAIAERLNCRTSRVLRAGRLPVAVTTACYTSARQPCRQRSIV